MPKELAISSATRYRDSCDSILRCGRLSPCCEDRGMFLSLASCGKGADSLRSRKESILLKSSLPARPNGKAEQDALRKSDSNEQRGLEIFNFHGLQSGLAGKITLSDQKHYENMNWNELAFMCLCREETKGRFCKRAVLANVPSFPFLVPSFRFFCTLSRVSGVRRSVFCTLIPVLAQGSIPQN